MNVVALYKKKKWKSSRHYSSASGGGGWEEVGGRGGRERNNCQACMELVEQYEKSCLFILVHVREIPVIASDRKLGANVGTRL